MPSLASPTRTGRAASRLYRGRRTLDLKAVLESKIRAAFEKLGSNGLGWHDFGPQSVSFALNIQEAYIT